MEGLDQLHLAQGPVARRPFDPVRQRRAPDRLPQRYGDAVGRRGPAGGQPLRPVRVRGRRRCFGDQAEGRRPRPDRRGPVPGRERLPRLDPAALRPVVVRQSVQVVLTTKAARAGGPRRRTSRETAMIRPPAQIAAPVVALALAMAGPGLADEPAPATTPIACPEAAGEGTTCLSGRDANGAWFVIAMPADWNRRLVVHAHGGPRTGAPEAADPLEDLERFSVMVRQGYAWIGSTYRRGGYGVRMAAEDTDNSRRIFWSLHGRPE